MVCKVFPDNLSIFFKEFKFGYNIVDKHFDILGYGVVPANILSVVFEIGRVFHVTGGALVRLVEEVLVGVHGVGDGAHARLLAVGAPHGLGAQVLVDVVNRVHLVQVEHVVQQLGCVRELLVANIAHCGLDQLEGIDNGVPVVFILLLGVDQQGRLHIRPQPRLLLHLEPLLHAGHELLEPGVLGQRPLVHEAVHLCEPLDEGAHPGQAVVPLGGPLGEEHHHVHRVALGRHRALGLRPRELEELVQEDGLQLGVGEA